ncbi:uncharacterized protein LOC144173138 [Haemaphysalis longicornis]
MKAPKPEAKTPRSHSPEIDMEEQEDEPPQSPNEEQEPRAKNGISVAVRLRRCTERIDRLEKQMDAFEHRVNARFTAVERRLDALQEFLYRKLGRDDDVNFLGRSTIEHCATEVVIGKKRQESLLLVNVYSNRTHRQQKFKALLHKATRTAPSETIAICGDFNAPHKELGYSRTTVKGRDLLDEATNAGFILYTNPATPTRIGTSTTRDSNPDLSFVRVSDKTKGDVRWSNTGHNLGSDHYIFELVLPTARPHTAEQRRKHKLTDWARFRSVMEGTQQDIADIDEWTSAINQAALEATTELDTHDGIQQVDSKLAHMIEARQSMQRRWKRQRHNRRLRERVAELGRAIEKYSRDLCTQRWYAACSAADGQLHKGQTWKLLRYLLDEMSTRGYQQHRLSQTMFTAIRELGEEETGKRINAKYLPSTAAEQHEEYQGAANPTLDQDIEEWEVRAVLQELNCKSAAGPDQVPNKALRNLNDGAVTALTKYFNRCWQAGKLPPQWKKARTVLIPKPGFREKLSTQDAMLLLQHEILDSSVPTRDNRAVLGLDLQSAFGKVRHSAILAQVSRLGMGRRSYNYIRDFLSERTVKIQAGNLQLDGRIEETLHSAVNAIEDHLDGTGLKCSPQKSELLIIPPSGRKSSMSDSLLSAPDAEEAADSGGD